MSKNTTVVKYSIAVFNNSCVEKMVDWLGVIWFQFSAIH